MKRKIVIEEYDAASGWSIEWPSWFSLPRAKPDAGKDFYPPDEKRHFFEDGETFKSISFSDGTLFAGCCKRGCLQMCVPIENFKPLDERGAAVFDAHMQAHSAAVSAKDVQMASEFRGLVESARARFCTRCSQQEKNNNRDNGGQKPSDATGD